VEDVRSVFVDEHAGVVEVVVRIPPDVRTFVAEEDALAELRCEPLGEDAPGEPRPDDQVVEHAFVPFFTRAASCISADIFRYVWSHEVCAT
jgi:hypothetical protein